MAEGLSQRQMLIEQLGEVRDALADIRKDIRSEEWIRSVALAVVERLAARVKVATAPMLESAEASTREPRDAAVAGAGPLKPVHYDRTLSTIPVPGLVVDPDGVIVAANVAAEELFGRPLIDTHVDRLVPARHRKAHVSWRGVFMNNPSMRLMGRGRSVPALHGPEGDEEDEMNLDVALAPVADAPGFTLALMAPKTGR
jgi:PAS domain-containing protein